MNVLTIAEVAAKVKLSKSTIYTKIQSGDFPRPMALGERRRVWPEDEVDAWLEACRFDRPPAGSGQGPGARRVAAGRRAAAG